MPRPVLALLAVLLAAACGQPAAEDRPLGQVTAGAPAAGSTDPLCSTTATGQALPTIYPASFALPSGTVVTSSQEKGPLATVVGSVPGDLDAVRAQFKAAIDDASLPVQSDDDEGFEAEYFFGDGVLSGVLRVVTQPCLPGRTSFALSLQRTG